MTVSVIIPVFNVEKYLNKCITSVIEQTYKDLEIILVNDGSTDKSGEICDKFLDLDERIKVIHKANGGLSDARNRGILEATGQWITFVDSDDFVSIDYVEYLFNLIEKFDADISIATYTYVTEKKQISRSTGEVSLLDTETTLKRMLLDDGFDMGAWAKMYRADFFKKVKFPVGKLFEDSYTTYRIVAQASRIAFGSKAIYFYINRSDSIVNQTFNPQKFDLIEMNQETKSFIESDYPSLISEANRRLIWAYFSTLNQVLNSNNKDVIDEHSPQLVEYIISQNKFIKTDSSVPKRDKIAFYLLKYLGIRGYRFFWKLYLKILK